MYRHWAFGSLKINDTHALQHGIKQPQQRFDYRQVEVQAGMCNAYKPINRAIGKRPLYGFGVTKADVGERDDHKRERDKVYPVEPPVHIFGTENIADVKVSAGRHQVNNRFGNDKQERQIGQYAFHVAKIVDCSQRQTEDAQSQVKILRQVLSWWN